MVGCACLLGGCSLAAHTHAAHATDIREGKVHPTIKRVKTGLQFSLLYWPWHTLMLGSGGVSSWLHVVDVTALVCQHMLVDTLSQLEVLTKLSAVVFGGSSQLIRAIEGMVMKVGSVRRSLPAQACRGARRAGQRPPRRGARGRRGAPERERQSARARERDK